MNSEDQQFIQKLLDPATQDVAFRTLMNDYKRPLYSHIRSIVIDHDDADDVLQDTFVKVFRFVKDFKGECRLFSWVYKIATNEALTFLKQKRKKTGVGTEASYEHILSNLKADAYFDGDEMQILLHKAVATLPEKQQLVFRMKYFEDMKYEEISEILGTTVGGLKASFHHAVKKIEDYVSKQR